MKKLFLLMFMVIVIACPSVQAHPGRTDANGGHTCRTNCAKWGLSQGEYHYHDGGGSTSSDVQESARPVSPVITKKTLTQDASISFTERNEYNSHEYSSFNRVKQEGSKGVKRISNDVVYSNGVEASRVKSSEITVTAATEKVTEKGSRVEPLSRITSIKKTNKNDKFIVEGEYRANAEVVIQIDGKKSKRTKTDNSGKFTFNNVKIKKDNAELIIYKRENRKESQISEKVFANLKDLSFKTEYDQLHGR